MIRPAEKPCGKEEIEAFIRKLDALNRRRNMIHKRIITLEGPEEWIKTTLRNSLKEGLTDNIFGDGKSIMVETIEGEPLIHKKTLTKKPEARFNQNNA